MNDRAFNSAVVSALQELRAIERRRGLGIAEAPGVFLDLLHDRGFAIVPLADAEAIDVARRVRAAAPGNQRLAGELADRS